jgi:hypothetical protein
VGGLSDTNQEQSINECALACKNMFTDLLFPKSLCEAIIQHLDHEYKTMFIRLIEHRSTPHGRFKINKYPQLEEIP